MCATDIHFQKPTEEVCRDVQKCLGTALWIRKKQVERSKTISLGASSLKTSSIPMVSSNRFNNRDLKALLSRHYSACVQSMC